MEGIEQRKLVADLSVYGCIEQLKYLYRGVIVAIQDFDYGETKVAFCRMRLTIDTEFSGTSGDGVPASLAQKEGWVARKDILSREFVEKAMALEREQKKH